MTPESSAPAPESSRTTSLHWLVHILLMLVILLVWRGRAGGFSPLHDPRASAPPVVPRGDLRPEELDNIDVYRRVAPSVVNITSLAVQRDKIGLDATTIPQGTGSGFVWDDQGYIVTNYHVLSRGEEFRVTLSDWTRPLSARVVGIAPDHDLAVLKIDAPTEQLKPASLGTSTGLLPGQKVLAIGSPFELDQTLTTGVISGLEREITALTNRPIQGAIQTDAAINPGNSGGPLLDSAGLVIGVNAQIRSPSGASAGIGFAIPIDTVRRIVPQLIRNGKVERIGLGIRIIPDQTIARLGLQGVMIREVDPQGPAADAGLEPSKRLPNGQIVPGDLIIAANGRAVTNSGDLYRVIDQLKAGDELKIRVLRQGKEIDLNARLAVLPQ
ncbi:MAG TPA: 2-alkenal reductase [Planctomycetaceae bacterium]|nr:2-alkenal reductase [Planctomycetaceae bacterium]